MIEASQYKRRRCPYCRSPRIVNVALLNKYQVGSAADRFRENIRQEPINMNHTQCENCRRVFWAGEAVWALDRAAMKRDYMRLKKLLGQ